MNPRLLFHNVYALGTPSSSPAAASGYPATNVADWRPGAAFAWRAGSTTSPTTLSVTLGASQTVDTVFIAGHNFGSQTTAVTLSLTSPATRTNFATIPNTWGTKYFMAGFSAASGTTFTLSFGGTFSSALQAGIVVLGQALEFPIGVYEGTDVKGYTPGTEWTMSETGHPLGASFTTSKKSITLDWPDPGFTDAELYTKAFPNFDTDFRDHAVRYPFAFGANLDIDSEGLLSVLQSVGNPYSYITSRRSLTLTFNAYEPR